MFAATSAQQNRQQSRTPHCARSWAALSSRRKSPLQQLAATLKSAAPYFALAPVRAVLALRRTLRLIRRRVARLLKTIRQIAQRVRRGSHRGDRFPAHLRNHGVIYIGNRVPQLHLDQLDRFVDPLAQRRRTAPSRMIRCAHNRNPSFAYLNKYIASSKSARHSGPRQCLCVRGAPPGLLGAEARVARMKTLDGKCANCGSRRRCSFLAATAHSLGSIYPIHMPDRLSARNLRTAKSCASVPYSGHLLIIVAVPPSRDRFSSPPPR